jgi:hypothetical protein
MRWVGHVANIGKNRNSRKDLVKISERKCSYVEVDVGGMIILKLILDKSKWGMDWINLAQDRDQ